MEWNFRITIDVTPAMERLVGKVLAAAEGRYISISSLPAEKDVDAECEVPKDECQVPKDELGEKIDQINKKASETLDVVKKQAEETERIYGKKEGSASIDDEEMKKHMDLCISKFAGNGWRDSKEPRVLAIRKGCTKVFKEIAKWLGAEKPTALSDDKRNEFVNRLEEVFIEEKGEGKVPEIVFRPF